MAYQVLALKYRPRSFKDVAGQDAVVTTLRNSLSERRIAHGYIFSGVRGVGKTTLARIFARALNCAAADAPAPEPCGECVPCREILEGRSLDVYEIDGASNSGVEKMRELIEMARYSPAGSRYRIFIIDEFHQISRPAFNALLKTLEEPPPHVVFIMATTEIGKVLPTILSRCQQFDMRRIRPTVIAARLKAIAEAEGIEIGAKTLALLARSAGGSMRDALTAMDQVIASCGRSVPDEEARTVLGVIPEEEVNGFFERLAERDAAGLLRLIAHIAEGGYDLVTFGSEIYHSARRLLLARTLPDVAEILDLAEDEAARARALADRFGEDDLLRIFNAIEEAQGPLRFSPQPRFLLEAAAVRLAKLGDLVPVEELLARLESGGTALPAPGPRAASQTGGGTGVSRPASPAPAPAGSLRPAGPAPAATKKKIQGAADAPPVSPAGKASSVPAWRAGGRSHPFADDADGAAADGAVADGAAADTTVGPAAALDLGDEAAGILPAGAGPLPPEAGLFERLLERLEADQPALAQAVGMAEKAFESKGVLSLPFPERSMWRKRVEEPSNIEIIARIASELAGRAVTVRVGNRGEAGPGPAAGRGTPDKAIEDPAVRSVAEIFRARVLEVRDNKNPSKS